MNIENMEEVESKLHEKYKDKWSSKYLSVDELKTVAKDLYNGLIFTDRHCEESILLSVFMPLIFMGPHGGSSSDTSGQRDSKIYDLLERDIEKKYYEEFINNIGMIYEYISQAGPMGINGKPTFMSCKFLTKEDTSKMFEYYDEYKELRKLADNF